jgi:hypothetical protein
MLPIPELGSIEQPEPTAADLAIAECDGIGER